MPGLMPVIRIRAIILVPRDARECFFNPVGQLPLDSAILPRRWRTAAGELRRPSILKVAAC